VLNAYEEAENALVAYVREQVRRDYLVAAVTAAESALKLARMQYESGVVDFQQVLEAQRAQLTFQESLAISSAAVATDLIALYKALGGGWESAYCGTHECAVEKRGQAPFSQD
jgi:outer membrane protein TolC